MVAMSVVLKRPLLGSVILSSVTHCVLLSVIQQTDISFSFNGGIITIYRFLVNTFSGVF